MKYIFLLAYNFLEDFFHLKRIKNFLKTNVFLEKPTIIDVGAHKGKLTRMFFDLYNDAKIYCFEPNKKLIKIIKKNNNKKNLVACNYALGEKKKNILIKINALDLTSSLSEINENSFYLKIKNLILKKKQNSKMQKITVLTLDQFCKMQKIKKIDLIKLDVEGYEYMVLLGAKKIIKNIKYIIIEIQKNGMYKNYSSKKIELFLKKNNFSLIKEFKFPFMFFQDRIYKNKKFY